MNMRKPHHVKMEGTPGAQGGTNTGGQPAGGTPNAGDPAAGGENNTVNNLTDPNNIWHTTPAETPPADGGNNNTPVANPAAPVDHAKAFNEHVAGLNLTEGVDVRGIAALMNGQGEPQAIEEALTTAFNTIGSNVYRANLMTTNKLVDGRVKTAMDDAQTNVTGDIRADLAVQEMHRALPFAADPNVAPIAKAALNQFMGQGKQDLNTAIASVKAYFEQTTGAMTKFFNKDVPQARNVGGGFVAPNNNDGDESGGTDFLALLGGKSVDE